MIWAQILYNIQVPGETKPKLFNKICRLSGNQKNITNLQTCFLTTSGGSSPFDKLLGFNGK